MRNLQFYETLEEYCRVVRSKFSNLLLFELKPEATNNPYNDWSSLPDYKFDLNKPTFYGKLVDYIIDTRAPIFYEISHPSEHFAFSGAYHFETKREKYPNIFRRNLFWLHDFIHMLFPYAHDVYSVSEKKFQKQFAYQERIASTETEIFAYYRIPGLRQKVFQDEKLYYDVIRERGWWGQASYWSAISKKSTYTSDAQFMPNAAEFLTHRHKLVLDDQYGEAELGDYPEILQFFQQWRRLTPKWVSERYKSMVGVRVPDPERPLERFSVDTYEAAIENYEWAGTQEGYEQTTLDNICRAYAMLKWDDPPTKWRHVPEALHSLEGAVFFQS